jgi:hypothetical protein
VFHGVPSAISSVNTPLPQTPFSTKLLPLHTMKRKRPPLTEDATSRKKSTYDATEEVARQPCRLVRLLSQYGLLDSIAKHIFPKDLYALAATSKAAYKVIFLRKESRSSLLKKMECDGSGIRIRQQYHQKSSYFYQYHCSETTVCANSDMSQKVQYNVTPTSSPPGAAQHNQQLSTKTAATAKDATSTALLQVSIEPDGVSWSPALSSCNIGSKPNSQRIWLDAVESQPCVSCSKTTCNECRIHCVYQSIIQPLEDPDDPDEQPNLSGFAMLHPHEMGILGPKHFANSDMINDLGQIPWAAPFHDQGILDMPLSDSISAAPEVIKHIITTNLGQHSLDEIQASGPNRPSSVIRPFWEVSERRKRYVCGDCCSAITTKQCNCTLEKRFLDRWLCLNCYIKECEEDAKASNNRDGPPKRCHCGQRLDKATARVLCLWCSGNAENPNRRSKSLDSQH